MTHERWLLCGLLLLVLAGASCSDAPSKPTKQAPSYYVYVVNQSPNDIDDIEVKYDDGSWSSKLGLIEAGNGRTLPAAGMPPIPKSLTMIWRTAKGLQQKSIKLPEKLIAQPLEKPGRLQIEFLTEASPAIGFREDR